MAQYRWVIQERNGTPIAELSNLFERSITIPLNRPPEAHAKMVVEDPNAVPRLLTSGTSELVIFRDGSPVETVFQLTDVALSGDSDSQIIELTWLGIMSYLQYGLVNAGTVYTSTAQSRIAWGLVNTFQNRSGASVYGIRDFGAPSSDPTKSQKYEDDTDLLEAIIALSERNNGFDFSIDAGRYFRCHYPQRGTDKSGTIVLSHGTNVDGYSFDFNTAPGTIVTDSRVSGGPGTPIVTTTNTDARSVYGRREGSVQYSDVVTSRSALQQFSDALVAERSQPQVVPELYLTPDHPSIPWGSYEVGDAALVVIKAGVVDLQDTFRIVQMAITLDENDNEFITLTMNDT